VVLQQNLSVRRAFLEERVFTISWGMFAGLITLLFLGVIAAPLSKFWGAHGLADFLYRFYHLTCHQLSSRSWFILGEKLGVCVRCFATYLFLIPAATALFIRPLREWLARRSFLRFVLPIFLGLLSPTAIDGLLQLLTPWESMNLLRFITGGLAGIGTGGFLGYLVLRLAERIEASLQ
jgi:uncharacterized membrane protein